MRPAADLHPPKDGSEPKRRIVENIMYFARTLRAAGLPVGPGKVIDAVRAVEETGLANRGDFYWAMHAVFVDRRAQQEVFDLAFHVFWRDRHLLEKMTSLILPRIPLGAERKPPALSRRLIEALHGGKAPSVEETEDARPPEAIVDAVMTYSGRELLQSMDFESMSADELAEAKQLIAQMRLPIMEVPTRRFALDSMGSKIHMRATLRAALRSGGDLIPLRRRSPKRRHPPLVILCDISGSMSRYSRTLLHFIHAITNDRDRVYTFLFGTRLTNISRHLRHRDVDVALSAVAKAVPDWSGGTQIGRCLKDFNLRWSRRVLGQGALVVFISDGLDRANAEGLGKEMERLHKSCRRLIWLNPLLRYPGFKPKSLGVQAILPHVDEHRPVHNLSSLADLAGALGHVGERREERGAQWSPAY